MNYLELQKKQQELDDYIIRTKGLELHPEHLLSNMFSAAIDELMVEVKEDITNPEEWLDVAFFVLSIANKYNFSLESIRIKKIFPNIEALFKQAKFDLLQAHRESKCFKHWSNKRPTETEKRIIMHHLNVVLECIRLACIKLNTDMVTEYNKKYEINIERQNKGY